MSDVEEVILDLEKESIARRLIHLVEVSPGRNLMQFQSSEGEKLRFVVPANWDLHQCLRAVELYELGFEHGRIKGVNQIRDDFRDMFLLEKRE